MAYKEIFLARLKADRVNLALAVVGFAPLLTIYFYLLWNRPTYQFFPLALGGTVLLAWRTINEIDFVPVYTKGKLTQFLAITTLIIFIAACVLWSPWLAYNALMMGLISLLWKTGGKPLLKAFTPVVVMLIAIMSPPLHWDEKFTFFLRSVAMDVCCKLLDSLNIYFARGGNTVQLPNQTLFVEEACSGINSFILCNVLCLFWFFWQKRPVRWLFLAIPATSLFVILGNIVRITAGATASYYWHFDLLNGWRHETFGLILLLVYCGLILSLDQLFLFCARGVQVIANRPPITLATKSQTTAPPVQTDVIGKSKTKLNLLIILIATGGIISATYQTYWSYRHIGFTQLINFKLNKELSLTTPDNLDGWKRSTAKTGDLKFIETAGVHSTVWQFERNGTIATLAVDYPLNGFHNVAVCYNGNGWNTTSQSELIDQTTRQNLHLIKLLLEQTLLHAVVYHSVIDKNGNYLSASMLSERVNNEAGFRIQLFSQSYAPLDANTDQEVQHFFLQARNLLVQQIVDQLRKK